VAGILIGKDVVNVFAGTVRSVMVMVNVEALWLIWTWKISPL
jgi:hypothetical protein